MKQNNRAATAVDFFVGQKLKAMRKSAQLSQTELAEKVGVTFQQIQKYEGGTNRIGASRLWDFCQFFDVSPSQFFDGIEAHLKTNQKRVESKKLETKSNPTIPVYSNDLMAAK